MTLLLLAVIALIIIFARRSSDTQTPTTATTSTEMTNTPELTDANTVYADPYVDALTLPTADEEISDVDTLSSELDIPNVNFDVSL